MQLGRKKFILQKWNLISEKNEGNNYTSKINVFLLLHKIFILFGG